jgi:hypothetical protein
LNPKVAICLTSHDRLDCTRINQEIFKLNFTYPYILVHASSGAAAKPYLEDAFVSCKPLPHFAGAISLMKNVITAALSFKPDFLVLLDGDTWLLEEKALLNFIQCLQENPYLLMATCAWMPPPRRLIHRLFMEINEIVNIPTNRLIRFISLPRRMSYDAVDFCTQYLILRNYKPLVDIFCSLSPEDYRLIERQWLDLFSTRFSLKRVLRMKEREPVHPDHRFVCRQLGLHSEHWPAEGTSTDHRDEAEIDYVSPDTPGKQEALKSYPNICKGDSIQRLLHSANPSALAYYNIGAKRY